MAQRKRNIEFSRPDEPAFLKKLKSKIGFKENSSETVETKKENLSQAKGSDLADRDDEQPVYLINDESKITTDELIEFKNKLKSDLQAEKDSSSDGSTQKILFKKPNKDKDKQEGMQTFQSNKKPQIHSISENQLNTKKDIKPVKNANLLSFNDDDDDE